ncbi:MAG: hypothetical protein IE919_01520 [Thioclava sp.]|nr:hypothetical protein [Thioclava sp.]MBD3801898.1 hypothetical protein [Thioclava sp.]
MRSNSLGLAIGGVLFSALSAHAANFAPPKGCEVYMTVQMRNCQVANYYTCAGDPAGDQWSAYADGEGVYYISHIDSETRWIESISTDTGEIELFDPGASKDAPSFSALLSDGKDDYDFVTRSNFRGLQRYRGTDTLTGQSVTIDDVPLETITFDLREDDETGALLSHRTGTQYVSRKHRLFLSGAERFENAQGDVVEYDDSPVRFDFPGDPGFSTEVPEYDCDLMMTEATVPAPLRIGLAPNSRSFSKEALR